MNFAKFKQETGKNHTTCIINVEMNRLQEVALKVYGVDFIRPNKWAIKYSFWVLNYPFWGIKFVLLQTNR